MLGTQEGQGSEPAGGRGDKRPVVTHTASTVTGGAQGAEEASGSWAEESHQPGPRHHASGHTCTRPGQGRDQHQLEAAQGSGVGRAGRNSQTEKRLEGRNGHG